MRMRKDMDWRSNCIKRFSEEQCKFFHHWLIKIFGEEKSATFLRVHMQEWLTRAVMDIQKLLSFSDAKTKIATCRY